VKNLNTWKGLMKEKILTWQMIENSPNSVSEGGGKKERKSCSVSADTPLPQLAAAKKELRPTIREHGRQCLSIAPKLSVRTTEAAKS